jgi:hypothetical protein
MANLFADLPMPALNGPGAAVAVSTMGAPKTIVCSGTFPEATVTVEASVDGGTVYAPVLILQGTAEKTLQLAATHMRVNVSGRKTSLPFACNVDVAANDNGAVFATLLLPAGDGPGTAVDVSALPDGYTIIAGGTFQGATVAVEASEDGVGYAPVAQFAGQGGITLKIMTVRWLRTVVRGRKGSVPFTCTVGVGAAVPTTPASASDIDVQNGGVALGTFTTLNFTNGITAADAGGGVATISLTPIAALRIMGSVAGGVPSALTITQVMDMVSGTNGAIPTRTGGTWTALGNWITDGGDLVATTNASPTTPSATQVKLFAMDLATRIMPAFVGAAGVQNPLQPFLGKKMVGLVAAQPGVATFSAWGMSANLAGSGTTRAITTTNLATSSRRTGLVSAAGAGSAAGLRNGGSLFWRGNAAGLGGFHFAGQFAGLGSLGAPTDVNPSTLTNIFGVGCEASGTNMALYASGAVAQAAVDLGVNFPTNTINIDLYELHIFAASNGSSISYLLTRLNTGHTATGTISTAANLPVNTTLFSWTMWRANGGTASAVGIDIGFAYAETTI